MAQLSTYMGLTAADAIIPSENFTSHIADASYPPILAELGVAWIEDVDVGRGGVVNFNRWPRITISATPKAETDTFEVQSVTPLSVPVSTAYYGTSVPLSDEAKHDMITGAPASLIDQLVMACRDRMDAMVMGLATDAAVVNEAGGAGETLTSQVLVDALADYRTLNPPAGAETIVVLGPTQLRDLQTWLVDSTAANAAMLTQALSGNMSSAFIGSALGARFFYSEHVAVDSGDEVGIITSRGDQNSGLGLGIAEPINVVIDVDPQRKTSYLVAAGRWGVDVVNPNRVVALRSRAA